MEGDRLELWRLRKDVGDAFAQIDGYAVEAPDGFVGTVALARREHRGAFLIVLGGPWNGGRTLMLPAGLIRQVERTTRLVHLSCTRAQVVAAPPFENDRYQDSAYRSELSEHYAGIAGRLRRGRLAAAAGRGAGAVAFGARAAG